MKQIDELIERRPALEVEFPIMVNEGAMTVAVGSRIWTRPSLHRLTELSMGLKEEICGPPPTMDIKEMHKFYCAKLGPKFNRRFCAANYYLWVGHRLSLPVANLLRERGNRWRVYSSELVYRANTVLPYIQEAEKDGLLNLVPAIVVFQDAPSGIRKKVGGAAWRKIAHNSVTRNRKLMQVCDSGAWDKQFEWEEVFLDVIDIPSGILPSAYSGSLEEQVAARLAPRKTPGVFEQTKHIVRDAMRMTGDDFNPEWSLARVREEHEKASRAQYRKTYSEEPFASPWSFESEGYSAALLTSPMDIATEGASMHHCVGSYAHSASLRQYLVLRIDGKERATAGYTRDGRGWRLDQVYGVCNAAVSEACRAFAYEAVAEYTKPLQRAA